MLVRLVVFSVILSVLCDISFAAEQGVTTGRHLEPASSGKTSG